LDAFCRGLQQEFSIVFEIRYYSEHAMEHNSKSRAITYIEIGNEEDSLFYGAGISSSVSKSSIKAVISAVNNMLLAKK
jgi:2-isopropylmalate synthase